MAIPISGFTRLKSLFRGGINFSSYDDILKMALNAEVGSLPKDMLSKILSGAKSVAPIDQITIAKKGFTDALPHLSHGIEVHQRAQSISIHRILSKYLSKEKLISLEFLDDIDFSKLTQLAKETSAPKRIGLKEASTELTKAFSQVLPNCSKVNITTLNGGAFGVGYKLEFLDSAGEKILHDKVLKLFYQKGMGTMDMMEKITPMIKQIFEELTSNMTKREIITLFNNLKTRINSLSEEKVLELIKPFEQELAKNNITIRPEQVKEVLEKAKTLKSKDLKPMFKMLDQIKTQSGQVDASAMIQTYKNMMLRTHGPAAEANTSTYIRERLGHSLAKTDVIVPDYFDLKRGYAISEYSDDLLAKPSSKVNFSQLGLSYSDGHDGNKVAGRIIDIGGVLVEDSRLQDKLTLRYFKKIINQKNPKCREEYIEKLKTEIEHMNFLDKEKINKAIEIAKDKLGT